MGFRFHYGLHVLLSDCSPPPLAGTQLSAHYQLNDLIGCVGGFTSRVVGFRVRTKRRKKKRSDFASFELFVANNFLGACEDFSG